MSEPAPENAIDRIIGDVLASRYQIEHRLGEGAMGTVYKARHVKVGRPFAVKVLHPNLLLDPKVAQRFDREAELAGRLRHPNVIGVVDVGETTDGLRYMVMDFAKGDDLATVLSEAPMTPERIIHLTRQLLEGLYHAHEAGLIHRDFKPENVIVERDDHGNEVPRIVDFGIAILREGGDSTSSAGRLTTNGLVLGTPHYMAPEQAVADPIDHRIDLFALGIVIYEMLSGRLPFDGSGAEVARANLLLDPPLIALRVPHLEVDPLLEAFARRLMSKKRDVRPATAKAARELLDLIDRDRAAAAAALGVPLQVGTRPPQVTEPVQQQRPDPGSGEIALDPPSGEIALDPSGEIAPAPELPRPTDLEAPPLPARVAPSRPAPYALETSMADPLPWQTDEPVRSKRGWLIGGLGALGAAGVIIALAAGGGDDPPPAPIAEQQVVRPASPLVQPPAQPPIDRPVAEPAAESTPVEPAINDEPIEPPEAVAIVPAEPVKSQVKRPTDRGKPAVKQPAITKPGAVGKATVVKPAEPVVVKPAEPAGGVSSTALVTQYQAVGRALVALGDHGDDLKNRYRLIRIQDALSSPEKRATTAALLAKLQHDIANRK